MKFLFINDYVVGGGVENVMLQLVRYLSRTEKVTITTRFNQKEDFKRIYPRNVRYNSYYLRPNIWEHVRGIWRIYKLVKNYLEKIHSYFLQQKKYDVVIAIKEGDSMKWGTLFKAEKKFAWVHVDYRYLYWTKEYFSSKIDEINCMKQYDSVICVSNAVRDSIIQVVGNPGNLLVKYNPIDVEKILEKSKVKLSVLEEYIEKSVTRPVLVAVGRLSEQKGYIRLINACSRLNREFDFELWIIGEGEQRTKIEELLCKNDIRNVVLWGNQENPFPFIAKADWFICSSTCESYGLALQEAQILGIPVLATSCPAFEECVSDDEVILVQNSEQGLLEGLHRILQDEKLEAEYKKRSQGEKTQSNMFLYRIKEIEKLWQEGESVF